MTAPTKAPNSRVFRPTSSLNSSSVQPVSGQYTLVFFRCRDSWQELPTESKQFIVDLLVMSAFTERPELVELVESFYDRMKNLLDEEQKKQIEDALYGENPHNGRYLRGSRRQLDHDQNLDKLLPEVNWSAYFG
jgi:hypothetical protein